MKYRFYKPNVKQYLILERNGKRGTIYCGSSGSSVQYRYYNKLNERKFSKVKLSNNIRNWERLEIIVRRNKVANWLDETKKALTYFKCPDKVPFNKKRASITAMQEYLINHPEHLNNKDLSRGTLAKYRKLLKQNKGLDNSWASIAMKQLSKHTASLQEEINSYYGINKLKEVS